MTTQPTPFRVSFLMLTYNQAHLVRDSALACLAQECEPLDIVFSDDASTDHTFEVLQEIAAGYHGPHRLTVRRNPRNLGIGEHFNTLIKESQSVFLIASAGDDISLPNRAQCLIQAWDQSGQNADLITTHCIRMHHDGTLAEPIKTDKLDGLTPEQWLQKRPYIVGATHAFTKRLHDHFGPFNSDVVCEDQIMVFRAICLGTAISLDQAHVHYRDGGSSRKPRELTLAEIEAWDIKVRKLDIIEMRQILRDADKAGQGDLARRYLGDKLSKFVFLNELSDQTRFADMWSVGRKYTQVPIFWRYKRVITHYFRKPYAVIQRHNKARKDFFRRTKRG